jgi:hypothetical protein
MWADAGISILQRPCKSNFLVAPLQNFMVTFGLHGFSHISRKTKCRNCVTWPLPQQQQQQQLVQAERRITCIVVHALVQNSSE